MLSTVLITIYTDYYQIIIINYSYSIIQRMDIVIEKTSLEIYCRYTYIHTSIFIKYKNLLFLISSYNYQYKCQRFY